jgi:branched-chain amino acid transport system substrate-binding protein
MSRTCAPTAINSWLIRSTLLVLLALWPLACTSTRPVVKIGLLAPFEGLYRRTGYTALDAMREAIAALPTRHVELLPLALDGGNDPQLSKRAAQKMLVDPTVRAIIGPLTPATVATVAPLVADQPLLWLTPIMPMPSAEAGGQVDEFAWAAQLVAAVAVAARDQASSALVLAGWSSGWPEWTETAWSALAAMPVRLSDEPATVRGNEGVLWLGEADQGARYFTNLRHVQPNAPFFLGIQGEELIFQEQTEISGPVYWAAWVDEPYDRWAETEREPSPFVYWVVQATQQAIAFADGVTTPRSSTWQVRLFPFMREVVEP